MKISPAVFLIASCFLVFEPCGCNSTRILSTEAPTFDPPDCYTDLNIVHQRERNTRDVSTVRTYVLCPDTEYVLGRTNAQGEIIGGFNAFAPRPNVHYKCGDDGSSANNCIIRDGDLAIASIAGDPVHSNVVFEGLTIEENYFAGAFFNRPGDITFVDCIFRVCRLVIHLPYAHNVWKSYILCFFIVLGAPKSWSDPLRLPNFDPP
jgi:hypothetical protein